MKAPVVGAGVVLCAACAIVCHGSVAHACPRMYATPPGVAVNGNTSTITYDGDKGQSGHVIQFSISSELAHPGSVSPATAVANQNGNCYTTYTSGTSYGEITVRGKDLTTQSVISCRVVVFAIEQSDQLWYFDGPSPANFPVRVSLTARGTETGTFVWTVTQGFDKAGLVSDGDLVSSLTLTDHNSVLLASKGASGAPLDICISFAWNLYDVDTWPTSVYSPTSVSHTYNLDTSYFDGFLSHVHFVVLDQFGDSLPERDLPINELFSDWESSDCGGDNWAIPAEGSGLQHPTNAVDEITAAGEDLSPRAQNPPAFPAPPVGPKVDHFLQSLYAGSLERARGRCVSMHTFQRYTDHGRHE